MQRRIQRGGGALGHVPSQIQAVGQSHEHLQNLHTSSNKYTASFFYGCSECALYRTMLMQQFAVSDLLLPGARPKAEGGDAR